MKQASIIALPAILLMSSPLIAADQEAEKGPWSGEVSLTYIMNKGNTESETIGAKLKTTRESEDWRFHYKLEGTNESKDEVRSQEKYFGSAKADMKLGEKSYLFGLVEYEDDRFSGFDYQSSVTIGYGRTMLENDNHKLFLEGGPGYRRSKLEETQETEEEGIFRAALNYAWKVSDTTKFTEELSSEWGEEQTISKSKTQLKTKINSSLSMTLGYDVKYSSEVPEDAEKRDSTAYVALDYSF